jgi:hypothetical protein
MYTPVRMNWTICHKEIIFENRSVYQHIFPEKLMEPITSKDVKTGYYTCIN